MDQGVWALYAHKLELAPETNRTAHAADTLAPSGSRHFADAETPSETPSTMHMHPGALQAAAPLCAGTAAREPPHSVNALCALGICLRRVDQGISPTQRLHPRPLAPCTGPTGRGTSMRGYSGARTPTFGPCTVRTGNMLAPSGSRPFADAETPSETPSIMHRHPGALQAAAPLCAGTAAREPRIRAMHCAPCEYASGVQTRVSAALRGSIGDQPLHGLQAGRTTDCAAARVTSC